MIFRTIDVFNLDLSPSNTGFSCRGEVSYLPAESKSNIIQYFNCFSS